MKFYYYMQTISTGSVLSPSAEFKKKNRLNKWKQLFFRIENLTLAKHDNARENPTPFGFRFQLHEFLRISPTLAPHRNRKCGLRRLLWKYISLCKTVCRKCLSMVQGIRRRKEALVGGAGLRQPCCCLGNDACVGGEGRRRWSSQARLGSPVFSRRQLNCAVGSSFPPLRSCTAGWLKGSIGGQQSEGFTCTRSPSVPLTYVWERRKFDRWCCLYCCLSILVKIALA